MADESDTQHVGAGPSVTSASPNPLVVNAMMMPWFMGVPWIPKFSGDPRQMGFSEWHGQVQAMLRAQGLNEEQKIDFISGALEGEAKREMRLLDPTKRSTSTAILHELENLRSSYPTSPTACKTF